MLILYRLPGRAIRIGDDIVIHILEVNGSQVKVGVDAPKSVRVQRDDNERRGLAKKGAA